TDPLVPQESPEYGGIWRLATTRTTPVASSATRTAPSKLSNAASLRASGDHVGRPWRPTVPTTAPFIGSTMRVGPVRSHMFHTATRPLPRGEDDACDGVVGATEVTTWLACDSSVDSGAADAADDCEALGLSCAVDREGPDAQLVATTATRARPT